MGSKAAIYARYSSHAQKDTSIEQQVADCRRYCEGKGLSVVAVYSDRAMTGTNDRRPQFQQMLSDSGKGLFDTVVCWKVDRFARNREDAALNRLLLRRNGVGVDYAMETIESTPEGVLLESVLEGLAEYYSKSLAQNVRRGMMANFEEGKSVGGTPLYGYRTVDGRIEVDDYQAAIVREIFTRYAADEPIKAIADDLNGRGIRTVRGGDWNKNSFKGMLRNEKYIGVYTYAGERREGAYPRIIDDALFQKAQERMASTKRKGSRASYLLTGKVFCGMCGSPMVGVSGYGKGGRKYEYYACSKQRKSASRDCQKATEPRSDLERLIVQETRSKALTASVIAEVAKECHRLLYEGVENHAYISELRSMLSDTEKKVANLYTAYENAPTLRELPERIEAAEKDRDSLAAELARAEADRPEPIPEEYIRFWLESFRDGDVDDPEYCKRLVDTLVEKVTIYDEEGGTKYVLTFHISEPHTSEVFAQVTDGGAGLPVGEHGLFFYEGGFGLVIWRQNDTLKNGLTQHETM